MVSGRPGAVDEHGHVVQEPWPECYFAEVHDHTGAKVAIGAADTITEALLRIRPTPPLVGGDDELSDEPPF